MEECDVGSEGREGENPPAIEGGHGAITSLGCGATPPAAAAAAVDVLVELDDDDGNAAEEDAAGKGESGLQSRSERCLAMNRTMGEVRKSSSVHCSHLSRSVVSAGVSRCRGVGVVIAEGDREGVGDGGERDRVMEI